MASFRLCYNVILSVSEESRLFNYRRDSWVALLPQNVHFMRLRHSLIDGNIDNYEYIAFFVPKCKINKTF